MGSYVPHTDAEIGQMLSFLGMGSTEELFSMVPEAVRLARPLRLPAGQSEPDVRHNMEGLSRADLASRGLTCFAGAGAYDHEIAAVTPALSGRSEFLTAYTPYQAEVSQGVLQALFEFQTMVARLSGMEVANASLYDGASATVEAANLACAVTGRQGLWVSDGVHPHWRAVLGTMAQGPGRAIWRAPLRGGVTDWAGLGGTGSTGAPAALIVAYPNFLGCLDDLGSARKLADDLGSLLVVVFDPVAAAITTSPGEAGADVAVAEGQGISARLSYGGPYLGLFATKMAHVRRSPGRIVGETQDVSGTTSYVTTLRAREQDIRRERASSNVCTNQTLLAVAAAVQLSWLGPGGLRQMALASARGARYARESLLRIDGVTSPVGAPVLKEAPFRLPTEPEVVIERLLEDGYLAGVPVREGFEGEEAEGCLLVAVTEKRTRDEIDGFVAAFEKALR